MTDQHSTDTEDVKTPFTFKLMIVLTVLYLGWRLVEGIVWLVDWLF
jgi:hypothetical protein